MQVVHVDNAVDAHHVCAQFAHIHAGGRLFHEDRDRAAQEPECAWGHEDSNQERGDRVGARPAEGPFCACCDDHREGTERIVCDLEERRLHVEVRVAPAREDRQRHDVCEQADDANEEHGAGLDGRGRGETPRGLPRDHHADSKEHSGLQGGGQDLGARPPPRVLLVARAARQVGRDEGDDQAGGVHDHVPRVSRQGQGTGPKGTEQLCDDDGPRHCERPPQARGRGSRRVGMIVRVATFRAARGVRVVVGVGHGLVNVGRGRGGLLRSGAAGRGRRESA